MRRLNAVVLCISFLVAAATSVAQAAPTVVTISGSPLTVIVGSDTSFQLVNAQFPGNGQIYPGSCITSVADAGIFAAIGGTLYGPDFNSHPCGTAAIQPTPWTPVSISGVTGAGTASNPYKIAVVVDAGTTGVRLTATFSYVNGDGFYRLTKTFCSSTQTLSINVYIGADIYLAGSDIGIPTLEPTSQSPGGKDCANTGYTILLVPTTPADRYSARGYSTVWSEIASQGDLSDLVDSGCIDNGAALEWKRTVAAGSCVTITSASSFGPIPAITQFSVGSVTPNQGAAGQTLTVTVSGIGFQSGTTFNFGSGITVNSTTINNSSQATVSITIAPSATAGPRDVTGTQSPGGLTSTASGAFTVTGTSCPAAPANLLPRNGSQGNPTRGALRWTGSASSFTVFFGPGAAGCSRFAGTTTANSFSFSNLAANAIYSFRVEANGPGCPTVSSACATFSTSIPCPVFAPSLLEPAPGAKDVPSPITFRWAAAPGATAYTLYVSENNQPFRNAGTTSGTQMTVDVAAGAVSWYLVATFGSCGTATSGIISFNAVPGCAGTVAAPKLRAVALVRSDQKYHVSWDAVANADTYEIDVATNSAFTDAKTIVTTDHSIEVSQSVTGAKGIYYRGRSRNSVCNTVSDNSRTVRTVVVPPEPATLSAFTLSTEFGSLDPISQDVLVGGTGGTSLLAQTIFHATTDRPWLSVTPSTGTMPAMVTVTADPRGLLAGSTTGTLIITTEATTSANTPPVTVPISISLATPVAPTDKTTPGPNSLIVPAVAHVDGRDSVWRSDIRIANVGAASSTYRLLLTISDAIGLTLREGSVDVKPGATLALDDVVKNWFGFGPLGDGANATLEIRPTDPAASTMNTAASSRTYNVTPAGTLGQFIPAVPFTRFLGSAGRSLVLQPVTQNALFRTNLGIVEGTGTPVNVLARFFDAAGTLLLSQTFAMKGGDQVQLPAFLAQQNISVTNGSLDVSLQSASGAKVTAYTSVVDNRTGDGDVTIGSDSAERISNRFVVAGIGKTSAGGSNWQSDVTLLNAGSDPADVTLTFVPQGSSDRPTATVHINPRENKVLADVVATTFGMQSAIGALDVDTASPASLLVEGRTFNNRSDGTVGQALPAFTPADAATANGRTLQILNIEESERYRSNLGLAEVTGHPVTVEITGYAADTLASPVITLSLGSNEFVQMSRILTQLGFGRTYNGRISVSVVDGAGAVAAYISSVDNQTDDPTYIPAQ